MITDKLSAKKIIIKITCILLPVIFIFVSCGSKNDEDMPFLPMGGDIEISEIRVIVGKDDSLELVGAAEDLCDALTEAVGKSAYISYEGDITSKDGAAEIWLGYGSTNAARGIMRDMRADDFICRELDGALVIGGMSDRATLNAIERYCREILPSATKYRLIPENGGFEYVGDYSIDSARINGVPLKSFEIVIKDRGDSRLLSAALYLQNKISEKTGFWIDIVEEDERVFEANGIFLNVKKQNTSGVACIIPSRMGIELTAEGYVGLFRCADKFAELFDCESGASSINAEVDKEIGIEYPSVIFRIASMRLDAYIPLGSSLAVGEIMAEAIDSRPDILLTGKIPAEDGETVLKNFSGYSLVKDKNGYVYGYAKNISCRLDEVTERDGIRIEYYTVEKDGVSSVLIRISGRPTQSAGCLDISDRVLESGLSVTVLSQTVGASVSQNTPDIFVKRYSDCYTFRNEENFFECYTVGNGASADLSFEEDGLTTYREITVNIEN